MYTPESIQAINNIPIYDVISKFMPLKKHGHGWVGLCIYHGEKTPSFHIDPDRNIFKCFGCNVGGDVINFLTTNPDSTTKTLPEAVQWAAQTFKINVEEIENPKKKTYTLPTWKNNTDLPDWAVRWFENRKLNQETVKRFKITAGDEYMPSQQKVVPTLQFNYFRDEKLVNVKYRDGLKGFKLHTGSELILYNLDSLKGAKEVFITEGCPDTIAIAQAGYWRDGTAVLSVPAGANLHSNNLTYIDNCIELFDKVEKIHIALDNDPAGRKLREALAERFGKDKCDYIDWMDQKDANDVLKVYGIQGILDCCSNPIEFPMEGVFTISNMTDEIDDMYLHGLDKGVSINLAGFHMRFVKGYLTVITGIPSHGKTSYVDELALRLVKHCDWKGAFYSPENKPTKLHFANMAQRIIGKSWDGKGRMTKEEVDSVKSYLDKKIWFMKLDKSLSLDTILEKVKDLKKRFGIDFFVIDAWNKLDHKGGNDPNYIGRSLDQIATFCEHNLVHCFMVAHPTKIDKDKKHIWKYVVPTMYNINGTADWFNKADNGICVYREFDQQGKSLYTTIYRQKIKFRHWGWVGNSDYKYDEISGRYHVEGCPDYTNWITGQTNPERVVENNPNSMDSVEENKPPVFTENTTFDEDF